MHLAPSCEARLFVELWRIPFQSPGQGTDSSMRLGMRSKSVGMRYSELVLMPIKSTGSTLAGFWSSRKGPTSAAVVECNLIWILVKVFSVPSATQIPGVPGSSGAKPQAYRTTGRASVWRLASFAMRFEPRGQSDHAWPWQWLSNAAELCVRLPSWNGQNSEKCKTLWRLP